MAPGKDHLGLQGALAMLNKYINSGFVANGIINIPSNHMDKIQKSLKFSRQNSITIPSERLDELVALFDANIRDCSRLNPDAYEISLDVVLHAEDSRTKERGIFILASNLFQDRQDVSLSVLVDQKIEVVGMKLLEKMVKYFCDLKTVNNTRNFVRRWVGLLLVGLISDSGKNRRRMELMSENTRRGLGLVILEEKDEILKVISGQILRGLVQSNIPIQILWPVDASPNHDNPFPESSQPNHSWRAAFQHFVDGLIPEDTEGPAVYYVQAVFTDPNAINIQSSGQSISILISEHVSIHVESKNETFDQCLDIPIELFSTASIQNTTIQWESSMNDRPVDVHIIFEDSVGMFAYLNARAIGLKGISMTFNNFEEAVLFLNDISELVRGFEFVDHTADVVISEVDMYFCRSVDHQDGSHLSEEFDHGSSEEEKERGGEENDDVIAEYETEIQLKDGGKNDGNGDHVGKKVGGPVHLAPTRQSGLDCSQTDEQSEYFNSEANDSPQNTASSASQLDVEFRESAHHAEKAKVFRGGINELSRQIPHEPLSTTQGSPQQQSILKRLTEDTAALIIMESETGVTSASGKGNKKGKPHPNTISPLVKFSTDPHAVDSASVGQEMEIGAPWTISRAPTDENDLKESSPDSCDTFPSRPSRGTSSRFETMQNMDSEQENFEISLPTGSALSPKTAQSPKPRPRMYGKTKLLRPKKAIEINQIPILTRDAPSALLRNKMAISEKSTQNKNEDQKRKEIPKEMRSTRSKLNKNSAMSCAQNSTNLNQNASGDLHAIEDKPQAKGKEKVTNYQPQASIAIPKTSRAQKLAHINFDDGYIETSPENGSPKETRSNFMPSTTQKTPEMRTRKIESRKSAKAVLSKFEHTLPKNSAALQQTRENKRQLAPAAIDHLQPARRSNRVAATKATVANAKMLRMESESEDDVEDGPSQMPAKLGKTSLTSKAKPQLEPKISRPAAVGHSRNRNNKNSLRPKSPLNVEKNVAAKVRNENKSSTKAQDSRVRTRIQSRPDEGEQIKKQGCKVPEPLKGTDISGNGRMGNEVSGKLSESWTRKKQVSQIASKLGAMLEGLDDVLPEFSGALSPNPQKQQDFKPSPAGLSHDDDQALARDTDAHELEEPASKIRADEVLGRPAVWNNCKKRGDKVVKPPQTGTPAASGRVAKPRDKLPLPGETDILSPAQISGRKRKARGYENITNAKRMMLELAIDTSSTQSLRKNGRLSEKMKLGQDRSQLRVTSSLQPRLLSTPSRRSLRLTEKEKNGNVRINNAVSETPPLVDEAIARKPAIVAFGSKGPLNQGSTITKKRTTNDQVTSETVHTLRSPIFFSKFYNTSKRPLADDGEAVFEVKRAKRVNDHEQIQQSKVDYDGCYYNEIDDSQSSNGMQLHKRALLQAGSQASRVDANGSPMATNSTTGRHVDLQRIGRRLLAASKTEVSTQWPAMNIQALQNVAETRDSHWRDTFASPGNMDLPVFSSNAKPQPASPNDEQGGCNRYKAHKKTAAGDYVSIATEKILAEQRLTMDPFVGNPKAGPKGKFAKLLEAGRSMATCQGREEMKVDDPEKTLVEDENRPSLEMKSSPSSMTDASSKVSEEVQLSPGHSGSRYNAEVEWAEALRPHQRGMVESLWEISNILVRHLISHEIAINDVLEHYLSNGTNLVEKLEFDKKDLCDYLNEQVNSRKKVTLQSCLHSRRAIKQRQKDGYGLQIDTLEKRWLKQQDKFRGFILGGMKGTQ